jgi:hypothetical protein
MELIPALKVELICRHHYHTRTEAKADVFEYITLCPFFGNSMEDL